jgi:hypothetical protein
MYPTPSSVNTSNGSLPATAATNCDADESSAGLSDYLLQDSLCD